MNFTISKPLRSALVIIIIIDSSMVKLGTPKDMLIAEGSMLDNYGC